LTLNRNDITLSDKQTVVNIQQCHWNRKPLLSLVAIADCTFPSLEIEQSILEAAQRCRKAA
jgi:hypothetical protein